MVVSISKLKKIGLFGSYSKNSQNQNSEIDILTDFYSVQETFDNLMVVYDISKNIFRGYMVEIVTKSGLSKYIGSYIFERNRICLSIT